MNFELSIVSLEKEIFSGMVRSLTVRGVMGQLEILAGHAPLLTMLDPAPGWIRTDQDEQIIYISGGILEVQPEITTILADTVLRADELDDELAKQSMQTDHFSNKKKLSVAAAKAQMSIAAMELTKLRRKK